MRLIDRTLRLLRRDRLLATGRLIPRVARLTALALVSLGWRPVLDEARAAPPDPRPAPTPEPCTAPDARLAKRPGARPSAPAPAPEVLADLQRGAFRASLLEPHVNRGEWPIRRAWLIEQVSAERAHGASALDRAIMAHLADPGAATPASARRLLELARADQHPDLALVGWAFRVARPFAERADLDRAAQDDLAALFAEAALHARVHQAIVETLAETGPVTFRPWMSKAAPRPEWTGVEVPDGFWPAFERRLPTAGAGTWDEPALEVRVASGGAGARLVAWGVASPLADGRPLQLARLDLVRAGDAPLVLEHATLGTITVAPGRALTALNVHRLLAPEKRKLIDDLITRAQRCDGDALTALQAIMPAAHAAIRAVAQRPAPPPPMRDGAPALRVLLALFDD
ncbi:MAG: hypothetical protein IT385_17870 [Deltaproteobacteria bacterium]|nr:hypothetical protein [Deltaproteobacteria bacterium]